MKNNKSGKLFDGVGNIGDDLIEEAASYNAKFERMRKIRKYSAIAASLVLVVAVALIAIMTMNKNKNKSTPDHVAEPIEFTEEVPAAHSGALPDELKNVTVKASGSDGKIIPTDSGFIVTTGKDCEAETVAE